MIAHIFKDKQKVAGDINLNLLGGFFFRFRVRVGGTKKKSCENDQFTGHFQSFFF